MRRIRCGGFLYPWRLTAASLACLVLLIGVVGSVAAETELDRRSQEIAAELNCPVCSGLTAAEASTPMAEQMRALIRKKLEEGEKREAILQYFVDRYGERILRQPPDRGLGSISWWVAAGALVVAGGALTYFVSGWWFKRSAAPVVAATGSSRETLQRGGRSPEVQVWKKQRSRKRRK